MAVLASHVKRLDAAEQKYKKIVRAWQKTSKTDDDAEDEAREKITRDIDSLLKDVCQIAQDAGVVVSADRVTESYRSLIKRASDLENLLVEFDAPKHDDGSTRLEPSYCPNYVQDAITAVGGLGVHSLYELLDIMSRGSRTDKDSQEKSRTEILGPYATPYNPASKPSTHTTPLARFRDNRPGILPAESDIIRAIGEARCEITSGNTAQPFKLAIAGSIMAVVGVAGFKEQDPFLSIASLDGQGFMGVETFIRPGLEEAPRHVLLDEARRLVIIADAGRVKSFHWSAPDDSTSEVVRDGDVGLSGTKSKRISLFAKHTMASRSHKGPITTLGQGAKLLRAGKESVAVWDVDTAPDHGSSGKDLIGGSMHTKSQDEDSDEDSDDEAEQSTGSPPDRFSKLGKDVKDMKIKMWANAASSLSPSSMICGFGKSSRCMLIDVSTGKVGCHWLGHSEWLTSVGTSSQDPHAFITTDEEGIARLYDVRQPTPVLAAAGPSHPIYAAALAYCDGHPFMFVGGVKSEQVNCWDVRARRPLYELATGNNEVASLAWDTERNALYAATSCDHVDRLGYTHGYRRRRHVQRSSEWDDEDDCEGLYWPGKAYHDEQCFGESIDAGQHRIYRYQFKVNADPQCMPQDGEATPSGRGW